MKGILLPSLWVHLSDKDAINGSVRASNTRPAAATNPITVNVPTNVMAKEITANGVYNPVDDGVDGYSPVTVNVPASGGSSGGVIVNRANPLPLSYTYRWGGSAVQTLLVPFIWPAG